LCVGEKKIDTKTRKMAKQKVVFNERFAMKTALEFDMFANEFLPKIVSSKNTIFMLQTVCL